MPTSLRVASLFAGIGGFDVGLERAGHRVVLQVEKDPHCREVLAHHFPGVALLSDVAEVLPHALDTVDLLVAGFPCNDCSFENAKRPGLERGRSTRLVRHVFRLLAERKVPWVILENVVGLLRWHRRRDEEQHERQEQRPAIDFVVTELERLGYRWAYRVVDLLAFGVPHKRRRVFIVASVHGDPRDVLLSQDSGCQGNCEDFIPRARGRRGLYGRCYDCFNAPPRDRARVETASVDLGSVRRPPLLDICHCLTTSNGRRTCVIARDRSNDAQRIKMRMLAVEDAERLLGFEPGHTAPCESLKRHAGSNSERTMLHKRFALLGLACAVQHSEWLGVRLRAPYRVKFVRDAESTRFDVPCPGMDEDGVKRKRCEQSDLFRSAWPLAAYNALESPGDSAGDAWMSRHAAPATLSESPVARAFIPLGDFLTHTLETNDPDKEVNFGTREAYKKLLETSGYRDVDELVRVALRGAAEDGVRFMEGSNHQPVEWCEDEMDLRDKEAGAAPSTDRFDPDEIGACGACSVCVRARQQRVVEDRKRHNRPRRSNAHAEDTSSATLSCVQVAVIVPLARAGHVGAILALKRQRAAGQRVRVFWPAENEFFTGTITSFNAVSYTFRIDYDDGDVEDDFRPWCDVIVLVRDAARVETRAHLHATSLAPSEP